MFKKPCLVAAALLLATTGAHAAEVNSSFNVTVAFTASCSVTTAASNLSFTYTSFDTAKTGSTSTVFRCSRGLTPTFRFDNTGVAQTGSAAAGVGMGISAEGVVQGIRYTLAGASTKSATGTEATAGTGGTGGSDGTPDEYTVSITANIPAGQAGTGAGGSSTQTRTLTIIY